MDVEMLADGSALATWLEVADGGAQFRMRRVTIDGARSAPVTIAALTGSRTGGSPRIARHGDEVVFAWTEDDSSAVASSKADGGTQRVRTAVARLAGQSAR